MFRFDNSYARDLPGFYVAQQPATAPAPRLLFLQRDLARQLGLDIAALTDKLAAEIFSGNTVPAGAEPLAQAYAGHQFGGFSPQLGDGRAVVLGEVIDTQGRRQDIAFKGSGRTAFSRGGDGKAAVGPMLREALVSEGMHALGVPTTRALAVVATGEQVLRETLLPGAVLTRVAASHLRVGTFQFFAARGDLARLRQLADYAIARHDPALAGAPDPGLALLQAVAGRQAALIAQWMNLGFIHGVMNTDNMTVSGETIDYGPCAFLEAYDPAAVFSSIDRGGRYAYGNQPAIARWNLARLGEALLPLMADAEDGSQADHAVAQVTEVIDAFPHLFAAALLQGQRAKLGLQTASSADDAADTTLAGDWLNMLHTQHADFTLAWRHLAAAAQGDESTLRALLPNAQMLDAWLARWRRRCAADDAQAGCLPAAPTVATAPTAAPARATRMRGVNPWVIPRNHHVEAALSAASDSGDMQPFELLLAALQHPFEETASNLVYGQPAPADVTACYKTFCGT